MSEVFNKIYSFDSLFFDGTLEASVGKIYQISELSLVIGGEIPEHTQRCDEITYVISI